MGHPCAHGRDGLPDTRGTHTPGGACGQGGPESCSVGWIVQLSVSSVVDEDYRPRVEVVLDLGDLRGEWDFSHSIGFRGGPMGLRW